MYGEFRDQSEYKAHVELEVKKRAKEVWSVFQEKAVFRYGMENGIMQIKKH